ncbi:hypothetical protein DFH06DRAFT_114859 [Mycena polygramma]|nr:hypothetical protein DFH06DRAFT_114859 [Mycena polygramma]
MRHESEECSKGRGRRFDEGEEPSSDPLTFRRLWLQTFVLAFVAKPARIVSWVNVLAVAANRGRHGREDEGNPGDGAVRRLLFDAVNYRSDGRVGRYGFGPRRRRSYVGGQDTVGSSRTESIGVGVGAHEEESLVPMAGALFFAADVSGRCAHPLSC